MTEAIMGKTQALPHLLDNALLLAINETAFAQGFINEETKEKVRKEIANERKPHEV